MPGFNGSRSTGVYGWAYVATAAVEQSYSSSTYAMQVRTLRKWNERFLFVLRM